MKKYEKQGFTNEVFYDSQNNYFVKKKTYEGFNHAVNYKDLNVFDFYPGAIEDNKDYLITNFIDGKTPELDDEFLKEAGKLLITLHNSKMKLPANNLARRFKVYRKIIHDKGIKIPVLDKYYKKINLFLKNVDTSAPCHNDVILANFIKQNKTNKIYLLDWEYATMGDIHFDLAYFIESQNLNDQQVEVFLEGYGDDFSPYILQIHRILVNYLVVLWVNKQDKKPFDETHCINKIEPYFEKLSIMKRD
ncbi:phosphotransferase [Mycoplasma zalophi]|uniref:Phosphotransferase n=1 Tax=Mycoplasma zalophi TaxID=191287 RepID=A0ABS6DQY3_9MOLU|nr:phosphotransferase [Mycoplasma zalophi]MBU4690976.1 phosphotransferase [Mycoplasma zalophi]MBU4692245.1 phosphotransferase [Mycoplasma zalophi]